LRIFHSFIFVHREIKRLNQSYYGGAPVLGILQGRLTINTSYMGNASVVIATISPMSITRQPGDAVYVDPVDVKIQTDDRTQSGNEGYAPTAYPSTSSQNTSSYAVAETVPSSRTFLVIIPERASPGDTVAFTAPTGQTVQVTLPQGSYPGGQMTVSY
jgi:hypothetical protein